MHHQKTWAFSTMCRGATIMLVCSRCGRLGFLGGNEDLFSGYYDNYDVTSYLASVYPDELMITNPYTADYKPVLTALVKELSKKGWIFGRDSDGDVEIICSRCNEEMRERENIDRIFYELGTTLNVEGNMFGCKLRREYLQGQWMNRRENPELYEEE